MKIDFLHVKELKKKQNDGNTFKNSIAEARKISPRFFVKHGEVILGQTLFVVIVIEKECKKKKC